jgi:hypothetical protein
MWWRFLTILERCAGTPWHAPIFREAQMGLSNVFPTQFAISGGKFTHFNGAKSLPQLVISFIDKYLKWIDTKYSNPRFWVVHKCSHGPFDHVQRIDFRDNGYTLAWNIHYQIFVKTVCKMTCYRVMSHKTLWKRKNSRERYHEIYHNQHTHIYIVCFFEHYHKK